MLLQTMLQTMVSQAVPLQPLEVQAGAETNLQDMEDPMLEQATFYNLIDSHIPLESEFLTLAGLQDVSNYETMRFCGNLCPLTRKAVTVLSPY
ncbi:hypothetical protein WISP_107395 [Willisornis vidua]|uniref:Uncharacterized protein n=1 Tax=Willisornis vidua TaxID=1566151 RepID=A0ABQ9CWJ8_9PASS|nr:hypothetical protein WISP_107395 [Willisornis vidua]